MPGTSTEKHQAARQDVVVVGSLVLILTSFLVRGVLHRLSGEPKVLYALVLWPPRSACR